MIDNEGIRCVALMHCSSCGADSALLHEGLVDSEFGAPGNWSLRQCRGPRCGLAWLNPHPLQSELDRFYVRYFTHSTALDEAGRPVQLSFDSTGVRKFTKHVLAAVLFWRRWSFKSDRNYLQGLAPGRLLDVGCGSGDFLAAMARAGWQAHGIDIDAQAINAARQQSHVQVKEGDLSSQRYADGWFDAVHMSNVIEHLPDPAGTLVECRRVMRAGGRLVIVTPNLASRGHAVFGADWRGLEPPRHLFLFNPTSLRRMAAGAGFVNLRLFSTPGGLAARNYIVERSLVNARLNGRRPVAISARRLGRVERLLDLVGVPAGDWLVLIADAGRS